MIILSFASRFSWIQDLLIRHAGEWWTYLATGLLCWLDGFFPPLPSESIIIAMSALSFGHGDVLWWVLFPVALVGAWCGDNTAYWIGRSIRLDKIFRGDANRIRLWKARRMLDRRGPEVLLTARFIPGWRVLAMMMSGSLRMPWRRFALIDIGSVMVWALFAFGIGAASGSAFHKNPLIGVVVGIAFGLVIGAIIDRISTRIQAKKQHATRQAGAAQRRHLSLRALHRRRTQHAHLLKRHRGR